jgi:hypothetical protein
MPASGAVTGPHRIRYSLVDLARWRTVEFSAFEDAIRAITAFP